jgi:hypothetical protein
MGGMRLTDVSVNDCDAFVTACAYGLGSRNPIGRDHLNRVRQRLIALIINKVRIGHVSRNVAEVAELPDVDTPSRPQRALSPNELDRRLTTPGIPGWSWSTSAAATASAPPKPERCVGSMSTWTRGSCTSPAR